MRNKRAALRAAGAGAIAAGMLLSPTSALADSDEREVVDSPTYYPWYSICKVKLGAKGKGRGSGVLVAPCTILTNGHVVYKRKSDDWREIYSIHPGSYYDEDIWESVDPFGSKPDHDLATNTSYVSTGWTRYDYGAIFLASSFEDMGLDTYIPVVFEYEASYINMAGYPSEDLPRSRTGAAREQWHAFGDVKTNYSRTVRYEATSTGGASGGGVWVYNGSTGARKLIAVNQGHHNSDNDGTGVRFVSQNEDLIRGWMEEDCGAAMSRFSGHLSFAELLAGRETLRGEAIDVLPPERFGIVDAPRNLLSHEPTMKVMQWIEGQFYVWEEYHLATSDTKDGAAGEGRFEPPAPRVVRLLEPETRILDRDEAATLLSASMLWMFPAEPSAPQAYYEVDPEFVASPGPATSNHPSRAPEVEIRP